jgi:hypothetical protein
LEEKIVECAQRIRLVLGEFGEVNVLRLSEHLAERSVIAYQALGWLAREGTVRYRKRQSQIFVSLSDTRPTAPIGLAGRGTSR